MVGENGNVLLTSRLYLQNEGSQDDLSTKEKHSYMVEDTPATIEHGHQRRVMGTIRGMVSREVSIGGIH
jgi:hypothetical protein